jgi:uncharacterized protein (TIGR00369 family)
MREWVWPHDTKEGVRSGQWLGYPPREPPSWPSAYPRWREEDPLAVTSILELEVVMTGSERTQPAESRRERTVTWHEPGAVVPLVLGLSGLDVMRGIRDGSIPPPPMARLMGIRCVRAEAGEIEMQLDHDPSLENSMAMLHGGAAATLLDTAMGCAAHTTLPVGSAAVTLDLTITYIRPITVRNVPVAATARVLNGGRRSIYVTGEVRDSGNALVAHAVGNFSVVGQKKTADSD